MLNGGGGGKKNKKRGGGGWGKGEGLMCWLLGGASL